MDKMDLISLDSRFVRSSLIYLPEGSYKMSSGEKINKEVLDNIGFKINLGIDINKKTCSQKIKKDCKYLKSWSVYRKTFSREIVLRGTIFDEEKKKSMKHNAGTIKKRVKKNIIVTERGRYCLIGGPEPRYSLNKKLEKFWMIANGFPKNFKEFFKQS